MEIFENFDRNRNIFTILIKIKIFFEKFDQKSKIFEFCHQKWDFRKRSPKPGFDKNFDKNLDFLKHFELKTKIFENNSPKSRFFENFHSVESPSMVDP